MKRILSTLNLIALVTFIYSSASALQRIQDEDFVESGDKEVFGSLIGSNTAEELAEFLLTIPSNDRTVNIRALNKKLVELDLPTIDINSPRLNFKPTYLVGYVGGDLIGAEIRDGTHRYCLPCLNGHNSYIWGISKIEKVGKSLSPKFESFKEKPFDGSNYRRFVPRRNYPGGGSH